MPLYEYECNTETCGDRTEMLLLLREYEAGAHPPCPTCAGPMHRIHLARRESAQHFDPVVYHEAADGRLRFPGSVESAPPHGFVRKELKTAADVRQFQHRVERIERSKIEEAVECEDAFIHAQEALHRPDLRMAMQRMSPQWKAFAQRAIETSNANRPKSGDAGFYLDVFENDRGTREPWNDGRTNHRSRHS